MLQTTLPNTPRTLAEQRAWQPLPSTRLDDGRKRTIIVSEDDDDLRGLVAEALSADGHRVVQVRNGWELLSAVEADCRRKTNSRIELIIADAQLPLMSGLEVVSRIRCRDRATPVLLLTVEGCTAQASRLGLDRVLIKPFTVDALRRTVADMLAPRADHPACYTTRAPAPAARTASCNERLLRQLRMLRDLVTAPSSRAFVSETEVIELAIGAIGSSAEHIRSTERLLEANPRQAGKAAAQDVCAEHRQLIELETELWRAVLQLFELPSGSAAVGGITDVVSRLERAYTGHLVRERLWLGRAESSRRGVPLPPADRGNGRARLTRHV